MDFSDALNLMKDDHKVARSGWNGKDMWICIITADDYTLPTVIRKKMTGPLLPWIGMKTAQGGFVPWLASQTDILADDWILVR